MWKEIPGYEMYYKINKSGIVKSMDREIATRWGGIFIRKGRIMKTKLDEDGYREIALCDGFGVRKMFKIHRLVAMTYIPNPSCLSQVNHKNNIKTDNRAVNLKWGTTLSNSREAAQDGLYKPLKGSKSLKSKLKEKDVLRIRKLYKSGKMNQTEIAKKYNVHRATIHDIVYRRNWAHIA